MSRISGFRTASFVIVALAAAGLLAASGAPGGSAKTEPPTAPDGQTHHEVADGVYVPVPPPAARRTSPAARPARNGFVSVQVNVDENGDNIVGDAANEPSIAVDPTNGLRAAIGWRQFNTITSSFRQAGWGFTEDGGDTWTFPGVIEPGVFRSDPVLDADADGRFYYNSLTVDQFGDFVCDVFISEDGGQTWGGRVFAWGGDKQWMTIDRTDGIGRGNIYANWTVFFSSCDGQFTRSYDQGESYLPCIDVPGTPSWGTLSVGPDGALYVVGGGLLVAKSSTLQDPEAAPAFDFARTVDVGGNIGGFGGPNPGGLTGQAWIATDHSDGATAGNVYVLGSVFRGGTDPLDVMFSRSEDGGDTWSAPVRVNDDPSNPSAWQWFGTMSVAPNGRIDVIWNDTRNSFQVNISEMFYASSDDGGRTWSKNVAVTPPFDSFVGWPQQNKLGDYYDMVSDDTGVSIAYAATFNGEQDVYFLRIGGPVCPADLDQNETVDFGDVVRLLMAWGPCAGCPEDLDASGVVDVADINVLIAAWGPCVTGACCAGDASCSVGSDEDCLAAGGTYQGDGTTCEATCLGACCFADGTCTDASVEDDCVGAGGYFRGSGRTCANSCATGACCLDGTCVIVIDETCNAMGGMYRGDDSTCATQCNFSNDTCADAVIVGDGEHFFSTVGASKDGPDLPEGCDEGGGLGFERDVWFRYEASCDGTATASVCDSNFNTRLAIYDDGDCPGVFVACSDDACGVLNTRSEATFSVQAGGVYLIRIGSRTSGSVGNGTLLLECAP